VAEAIPALAIDQVIAGRVRSTSAAELEAIERLSNELQAIVNLGVFWALWWGYCALLLLR